MINSPHSYQDEDNPWTNKIEATPDSQLLLNSKDDRVCHVVQHNNGVTRNAKYMVHSVITDDDKEVSLIYRKYEIKHLSEGDTHTSFTKTSLFWSLETKLRSVLGMCGWITESIQRRLPIKDFASEVRALRDVQGFLKRTKLILDEPETDLPKITKAMLNKLEHSDEAPQLMAAKEFMFLKDTGNLPARIIQGTVHSMDEEFDFDQSWLCILCDLPSITKRHVVISRLRHPCNLGTTSQETQFVILVLGPTKEKTTKSSTETGCTFSTLFSDLEFRHQLLAATTETEFKLLLEKRTNQLIHEQSLPENRHSVQVLSAFNDNGKGKGRCSFGQGILGDLRRRIPHYWSDYKEGIIGPKTIQKVISAILFLYFACVLPNIAFGMLNNNNTNGAIGVKKILFSQCIGGIIFAVFGGQPLIILLTTAPLALYTKIIYSVCEDFDLNFNAMFACVGLWNALFLVLYSVSNASKLMKWSSRSTEEIFSLFITFAFSADAIKDTIKDFKENYNTESCHSSGEQADNITSMLSLMPNGSSLFTNMSTNLTNGNWSNSTNSDGYLENGCHKENSLLFLLLMFGTLWMGLFMYNFTKTPFLNAGRRELLADYALPVSVIVMSFFGSYIFREVKLRPFEYSENMEMFTPAPIHTLPWGAILAAAVLGFSLSLLFFMDQNISSALVNSPNNKLKKGAAYHWDLLVVALINGFLSIFTFPWVHAALPHSPLHVRALADVEERVDQGHIQQIIVHVRETRLTGIISHVMIGLSMYLLPYPMAFIPRAVLDGLFLYVAITALFGNQLFERIMLIFTEQAAYPPNHYLRRVPQRKVHMFTGLQILQLLVLCVFGFSPIPYMKMVFPVLLLCLLPIRHKIVPKVIENKYISALDGH